MLCRTISFCGLLLVAAIGNTANYTFFLAGAEIGKGQASWSNDGTKLTSKSAIQIASTKIDTSVSATKTPSNFETLAYTFKSGATSLELTLKDGRISSVAPTPPFSKKPKALNSFFSNYHPLLSLFDLRKITNQKATYSTFILDNVDDLNYEGRIAGTKMLLVNGKPVQHRVIELKVGATMVEYWLDSATLNLSAMNVPSQKFMVLAEGIAPNSFDPIARKPELSQMTFLNPTFSPGISIPMRDSTVLKADLYRPKQDGKYPVILTRTPYSREIGSMSIKASEYVKRGYVVVSQDVRGTGDSQGIWNPFMNERKDGYDTIDWISKQPWCDGNIGMLGGSYGGFVQWSAAVENHPALKTIIPEVSPPDLMLNIPYENGMFFLSGNIWWANIIGSGKADLNKASEVFKFDASVNNFDLSRLDESLLKKNLSYWKMWSAPGATEGRFAEGNFQSLIKNVKIPVLNISGIWDGDAIGTNTNWSLLQANKNENRWLVYGPWTHAFNTTSSIGSTNYGETAIVDLDTLYLRWLDTWLKKKNVGLNAIPRALAFETGSNQWRAMDDYPAKIMTQKSWFLQGGKSESTRTLGTRPSSKHSMTKYKYDPKSYDITNFLPTAFEPDIWSAKTYKGEEIVFRGQKLTKSTLVSAPIEADIYFSTTAKDADLYFTVYEEQASGRKQMIGQPGKLRLSYRKGNQKQVPLVPGKVVLAQLRHWDFTHMFATGSRICVVVGSDLFPVFDRNLGFIRKPGQPAIPISATHTIYHSAIYPSRIKFMTSNKPLPAYKWPD